VYIANDAARLEASHGDLLTALELFDFVIDSSHRAGDHPNLAIALANLAIYFHQVEQSEVAARIYGTSARFRSITAVPGLREVVEHLRALLGESAFDDCVTTGSALELGESVGYARTQIRIARQRAEREM
jgi:hypothetical protein